MRIRVGVIFGGESVEHEVSVISAIQAMNKMDEEKYEIVPIYITKTNEWYTGELLRDIETFQDLDLIKRYAKQVVLYRKGTRFVLQSMGLFKRTIKELDIAFPIVHGTNVEDGGLQGYLQTVGIPYVGSSVYASVVGQDKVYMKQIFAEEKLPIVKYVWFYDQEYKENTNEVLEKCSHLKFPVIVKPATLGSSVGIKVAHDERELEDAILDAIHYDNKILVEQMVNNLKEVNISVLGNYERQQVSAIEEVLPSDAILTYADKYIGGGKSKGKLGGDTKWSKGMASASRKIPADLEETTKEEIETIATRAFQVLGSSGVCRIDFLVDNKTKKVYINEINSIPGSLSFYLWDPLGKKYPELLDDMINIAIKDYKRRVGKTHSFESNILKGFAESNGLKGLKGSKGKLG